MDPAPAARQPVHAEHAVRHLAGRRPGQPALHAGRRLGGRAGAKRDFLVNYNERTGAFGRPAFFSYGNRPHKDTHFEGITGVPGGFHLVALSTGQGPSMAFVPVLRHGRFGRARWYPVNVSASGLCPCHVITGNTVWRNRVMGLYLPTSSPAPHSYLATVPAG